MSKHYTFIFIPSGEKVDFVLDVSKRKNYQLSVAEGILTVRVPEKFTKSDVERLITDNINWINSAKNRSIEKSGLPVEYENGEKIRLLGNKLEMSLKKSSSYCSPFVDGNYLIVPYYLYFDKEYVVRSVNSFLLSFAEKEILDSMNKISKNTNLIPQKITIKPLSASWGRCSSSGNISINWKIITFPKECIDYVCLHELCHLKYMDHSAAFWKLVEKYCPDYKRIRNSMK